jgi:GTPase
MHRVSVSVGFVNAARSVLVRAQTVGSADRGEGLTAVRCVGAVQQKENAARGRVAS